MKAPSGKSYEIKGYVGSDNIVDRVETKFQDNIMGDMQILAVYSGWKDFGGVKAPAKIMQTRGGFPFFEVDVTAATGNPANAAALVPAPAPAGRGGAAPAAAGAPPALVVTSEKLGDGLYRLTSGNGSYDSVIVEFKNYIMMLEAGQSIARGEAYIAETKKLIPNKPIRYVMNTHPHSDHTGGLPALVAEGATIITQKNNEAFLSSALNTPRTLMTDVLAKNPKKANQYSVALELQADCYAGVWVGDANRRNLLDSPNEIQEAIKAAEGVGDDRIQEKTQGRIDPESWTHGSAEQRRTWFLKGFNTIDPTTCDTFRDVL